MLSFFYKNPTKYIYIPISINDHLTKDDLWTKSAENRTLGQVSINPLRAALQVKRQNKPYLHPFLPLHAAQVFLRE